VASFDRVVFGTALELEVVSGRIADEHRVVVRPVLRPEPRLVEDLGAACKCELVNKSDSRLVLDPEGDMALPAAGVGRREKYSWAGSPGSAYPIMLGRSKDRVPPAKLTTWSYQLPTPSRSST
jgi:hypothetical protein